MATRVARVIRGLIIAGISLLVAAVAHIAGGGQIGGVGFVLALTFSVLVSIGLTGRSVSRLRVATSVVFSQGSFHLLFGIGAGYQPSAVAVAPGMHMLGMVENPLAASAVPFAAAGAGMPDSGWMWLAHGLAALVTIVALVRGEKAFWKLSEHVTLALTVAFSSTGPISVPRRQRPEVIVDIAEPSSRFLLAGLRHRGPPMASASG